MKICIVKLSAMGDIIHAMVVLQFIKKQCPNIQIDWLVEEAFQGVLENNPHIDNILPINLKSMKKNKLEIFNQIKILKKYSKNSYDLVIDAQGLLKSAIVSKLISKKSKIIGFSKTSTREGIASTFYDKKVYIGYEKNVIDRNVKLFSDALSLNINREDILNKEPFLYGENNEITVRNYILFIVGASKPNKMYPKEKFLELAKLLHDEHIEVVWASDEEYKIAQYLEENSSNVKKCEKMSLNELKYKVSNSKLVIGADTGPTHMGWALNVPSITVFGPTPAYRNTYETNINKVINSDTKVNPLNLDYNDYTIQDIDTNSIVPLYKEILLKVN